MGMIRFTLSYRAADLARIRRLPANPLGACRLVEAYGWFAVYEGDPDRLAAVATALEDSRAASEPACTRQEKRDRAAVQNGAAGIRARLREHSARSEAT